MWWMICRIILFLKEWSSHSNEIRDFLGRNFVPHQWLNIEAEEAAKKLLDCAGADAAALPVVVFPDHSRS